MYQTPEDQQNLDDLLTSWQNDQLQTRETFVRFQQQLAAQEQSELSFNGRPGITYSLRAFIKKGDEAQLYAMVDIIDDDPDNRWLSVCFYGRMISDPDELGDFVPGGLQGEDASCFDYDQQDQERASYISSRLSEAHNYCLENT